MKCVVLLSIKNKVRGGKKSGPVYSPKKNGLDDFSKFPPTMEGCN